jgi:hypothetical protein
MANNELRMLLEKRYNPIHYYTVANTNHGYTGQFLVQRL